MTEKEHNLAKPSHPAAPSFSGQAIWLSVGPLQGEKRKEGEQLRRKEKERKKSNQRDWRYKKKRRSETTRTRAEEKGRQQESEGLDSADKVVRGREGKEGKT